MDERISLEIDQMRLGQRAFCTTAAGGDVEYNCPYDSRMQVIRDPVKAAANEVPTA